MHSIFEKDQGSPAANSSAGRGALTRERTTSIHLPALDGFATIKNRVNGLADARSVDPVLPAEPQASSITPRTNGPTPPSAKRPGARQTVFRCVRLVLAGVLVSSAGIYARRSFTSATSERAYINGAITSLRAPIAGRLRLEPLEPGMRLRRNAILFTVENPRFGNHEAMSQLNWVKELAERLQVESEEAALRFRQQKEIYPMQEKLYAEKLISRLMLVEEQSKLELARTAMENKRVLAARAEDRVKEIERQVELQKTAIVQVPFEGVAWAVRVKNGAELSVHETVVELIDPNQLWVEAFFSERHAQKLTIGRTVTIRSLDGADLCTGTVESVRAGIGRIAFQGETAVAPGEYTPRRVSARIRMNNASPFSAGEFFGVGRSVIVTLNDHE